MRTTFLDHDTARRAITAYMRKCTRRRWVFQQPTSPDCWRSDSGEIFVALSNARSLLAVYLVRTGTRRVAEVKPSDIPAALRQAYA